MALSYVWLLIKPSHLSLCVCCTAPSLISLPHPSVSLCLILCLFLPLHHSHGLSLSLSLSYTHIHTSLGKSLYSGESPGFDQGLFDIVIRSETQLTGPSLAAAFPVYVSQFLSLLVIPIYPSTVQNTHSFSPFAPV